METVFLQISLILLVVFGVSFIMRILKQPLIVGYIFSGIIAGPLALDLIPKSDTFALFSEFGLAFLLFIVGIHLNPKVIKEVGKISLITGIGQVLFTAIFGYFIGIYLGFSVIASTYISIALTFSSTIIIMKLLSDKGELEKLHGKISIGFLLVQDLIAVILLMIISSFSSEKGGFNEIISTFIIGGLLIAVLIPFGYYILPKMNTFLSKSQEFLFIFSIAWGLGLASLFSYIGFSIEIGALVAGISLSMTSYSHNISSKLKSLRDFFIISFFILLGSQIIFADIKNLMIPAIIFSIYILIGNPLIMMILMGIFGYAKKTSFMTGLIVAQISEFSLILIALGVKLGQIPSEILSFVTVIGLITIAGSSYLIIYSDKIYNKISSYLEIFERKKLIKEKTKFRNYEYFLLGENRIGFSIMKLFKRSKKNYVVIDYNPERIKTLEKHNVPCVFGDVSDMEFLESIKIDKAKMVVSTIPETGPNILLMKFIKEKNKNCIVIVTGTHVSEASKLYEHGADYVILPHLLGGQYVAEIIERAKENKNKYRLEKAREMKSINERISMGRKG